MIARDMIIADVIRQHPETIAVFKKFGLDCSECQVAEYGNVGHGAQVHAIAVETLLSELNRAIAHRSDQ